VTEYPQAPEFTITVVIDRCSFFFFENPKV